jgi:hypothetical protein
MTKNCDYLEFIYYLSSHGLVIKYASLHVNFNVVKYLVSQT